MLMVFMVLKLVLLMVLIGAWLVVVKGIIEQFPLTSVSIGVVVADVNRFYNMLEIGEVGAQVKHAAKSVMGSSYSVDKRKIL